MVEGAKREIAKAIFRSNTKLNVEVAKPQIFNKKMSKVLGFLTTCKLYIQIRMRNVVIKEYIQWILLYFSILVSKSSKIFFSKYQLILFTYIK